MKWANWIIGSLLSSKGLRYGGLASDFVYSMGVRGLGALLALGLNILLARFLGAAGFGKYMALLSMSLVLGGLSVRGVDYVLTRELTGKAGEKGELREMLAQWGIRRVGKSASLAAISFVLWTSFAYFGWPMSMKSPDVVLWSAFAGASIALLSPFISAGAGAINGYGASVKSQALRLVVPNGTALVLLLILYVLNRKLLHPEAILWIQAIAYAATVFVAALWLARLVDKQDRGTSEIARPARKMPAPRKAWTRSARQFLLVSIANLLVNKLDVVVISFLAGSEVVGIYAAGARLAQVAMMVALTVNVLLCPRIATAHKSGDTATINKLVRVGLQFTIPLGLVEILCAWFLKVQIVSVFGHAYYSSSGPFAWVVTAYALWTATAPIYALLAMTGREHTVARVSWVVLIVDIIAVLGLTPSYGADGAGLAMTLGYFSSVLVLAMLFFYRYRGHLSQHLLPSKRSTKS